MALLAVLALAAGIVYTAGGFSHSRKSTASTSGHLVGAAAPWATTTLPGQLALTLVGTDTDLYTVYTSVGTGAGATTVQRIDPAAGKVQATATIDGITDFYAPGQGRPVVADGRLWIPSGISATGSVILRGLDLSSLRTTTELTVQFSGVARGNSTAALAAAPDGTLYLGAGDSYLAIDPTTSHLGARTAIAAGQIGGLAVAPDNSRVYVGVTDDLFFTTYGSESSYVQTRRPLTGTFIAQAGGTPPIVGKTWTAIGGIESMTASTGGVWVSNQAGPHGESALFIPTDLHPTTAGLDPGATGGGGALALATTSAGTVWLGGGNHGISCVDPANGHVRASTIPSEQLRAITVAGHRAFAIESNSRGLVRITPPTACSP